MVRRAIGWPASFWLTVCAVLAVTVAYQLSTSFPLAPTVSAAPPEAPLLGLAERPGLPRAPDDDAVDLIAARPLFSEGRRPFVPALVPVAQSAPAPSHPSLPLELAGTYLTGTDQAALLLVSGGTPAWLRKGQLIEGWRIEAIAQDRVELRKDGVRQVLRLRDDIAVVEAIRPTAPWPVGRGDATQSEPAADPAANPTNADDATQQ